MVENKIVVKADINTNLLGATNQNGNREYHNIFDTTGYLNVTLNGAIGDGINDDTLAINSSILLSNKIYFPKGIYKVSSTIFLNKEDLEIYFDIGSKIIVTSGTYTNNSLFLKDMSNDNLKITGGQLIGINTLNAISIQAECNNIFIEGVNIKNFAYYAITIAHPNNLIGGKNKNIIIKNCIVNNTGEGIECNGSINCTFDTNSIYGGNNTYGDGLEIVRSSNFNIINNYLYNFAGAVNSSIDIGNDAINGKIVGNHCVMDLTDNIVRIGISVVSNLLVNGPNKNIEISNNNISGKYTTGLSLQGDALNVHDNTIINLNYYNPTTVVNSVGINMSDNTNTIIKNNILQNINGQGIDLSGNGVFINNNFINNCCVGTTPYEGLINASSGNNLIIFNNLLKQDNIGITRFTISGDGASNVIIRNNTFIGQSLNLARHIESISYQQFANDII